MLTFFLTTLAVLTLVLSAFILWSLTTSPGELTPFGYVLVSGSLMGVLLSASWLVTVVFRG